MAAEHATSESDNFPGRGSSQVLEINAKKHDLYQAHHITWFEHHHGGETWSGTENSERENTITTGKHYYVQNLA